ncbi:hypothetical protein GCM10022631_09000 [Deinococcus rubellus]
MVWSGLKMTAQAPFDTRGGFEKNSGGVHRDTEEDGLDSVLNALVSAKRFGLWWLVVLRGDLLHDRSNDVLSSQVTQWIIFR